MQKSSENPQDAFGIVNVDENKSGNVAESVSGSKSSKEKELRKLLKDKELFTVPNVIKKFMLTGYFIILILLGSLLFFINIEVMFAERLQQTSVYINQPSKMSRELIKIA